MRHFVYDILLHFMCVSDVFFCMHMRHVFPENGEYFDITNCNILGVVQYYDKSLFTTKT